MFWIFALFTSMFLLKLSYPLGRLFLFKWNQTVYKSNCPWFIYNPLLSHAKKKSLVEKNCCCHWNFLSIDATTLFSFISSFCYLFHYPHCPDRSGSNMLVIMVNVCWRLLRTNLTAQNALYCPDHRFMRSIIIPISQMKKFISIPINQFL